MKFSFILATAKWQVFWATWFINWTVLNYHEVPRIMKWAYAVQYLASKIILYPLGRQDLLFIYIYIFTPEL